MDLSLSLASIADDLAARPVKARELLAQSFENHQQYGDYLGAYVERDEDFSKRQLDVALANPVKGPLFGIPVSAKDLYAVEGYGLSAGTPQQLPPEYKQEGPMVLSLRRSGAIITGKTHTVEFAFGGLGTNPHWPTPRNPWDTVHHRVPGGSSAGAGVSLHTDALLALGTDTAGSVRIPAAMTGMVGLKTTFGRWPLEGIVPLSPSLDTAGLLARSVGDLKFGFVAIESALGMAPELEPPMPRQIRVGVGDNFFWNDCSAGVYEVVKQALKELGESGVALTDIDLPEAHSAFDIFKLGHLAAPELREFIDNQLPDWKTTLDPKVAQRIEDAGALTAVEYLHRKRILKDLSAAAHQRFQAMDVFVSPTVVNTPPKITSVTDLNAYRKSNLLALRNTCIANMLGLCAITLPVGLDSAGMPVGLQLFGQAQEDNYLVNVAQTFEQILGTGLERLGPAPLMN